jgi:hypothetical protein
MLYRVGAVSLVLVAACAQGSGDGDEVDARATDAKEDLIDSSMPDGSQSIDARVDAPTTPIDAGIDAPPGAAPDTCVQAQDITAAAMVAGGTTVTGDTTGYADDVRPASGATCTNFIPDGPDAIYSITVNAGVTITAVATPTTSWDISLELVQPCTLTPSCVAGEDSGFGGDPETMVYTTTAQGTYYIAVDGFNPGIAGPFSLNVRIQ